jgi:hypothetical protein
MAKNDDMRRIWLCEIKSNEIVTNQRKSHKTMKYKGYGHAQNYQKEHDE